MCQRCLTAFGFVVDSQSDLILARDEDSADEMEALFDDDEFDVVVGSKAFDVMNLIEDEVLLAIPQSPKHTVCPDHFVDGVVGETQVASIEVQTDESKVSPFAVLRKFNGRI
jgi:uncharacterized protein